MLDLLIVLAFVAYSVTMGVRARKKASQGLSEYFLAGRHLRGWQAGTSMAATQFAADTPLLVTGLVATGGVFLLWRLWIYGLAFLLLGFMFAGLWQRAGVITDAELTERRYSGHGVLLLRVLKAIYYGTVMNCVVLAMVLVAAVGIAETFLPWHEWFPALLYDPLLGFVQATGLTITSKAPALPPDVATANNLISIALILAFTAAYSMTGGLRGVVATDIVQFALALVGTILYAFFVVRAAGGLGAMTGELVEIYGSQRSSEMLSFTPQAGAAFLPFLAVMSLQWLFQRNSDGTGYLAQRSMACTDEHQARLACVLFAWLQIVLRSLPWLLIAVGLLVLHPFAPAEAQGDTFAAEREMLFVREIDRLLPVGVRGLLLTGMLAALASTLDTHMNWGASYWSNDIYQRLICRAWLKRTPGGHELVVVARLANLLILAIALVIMANLGSIQQAWRISLVFGAGVGSVLALRWLWERINVWAELAAMGVSLVAAPLVLYVGERNWFGSAHELTLEALNLGAMAVISTLALIVVARLTPPTDRRTLATFYKQVRPAGWWARSAREAGEDPGEPVRKLRDQVATTALAGLSLFLCLYGSARMLIPHPAVHGVIPFFVLLLGLALVPVWWRRAGKRLAISD